MNARPPLPPRPDFEPKPRSSAMWLVLTAFAALVLLVLLAFLVAPILWVGAGIAAVIALQYLLWGWWLERIYRSRPPDDEP